jgi:hypothetical protein
MENIINEFRGKNGRGAVECFDREVCNHCFSHSLAMSHRAHPYHAEPHLLNGWSEAVALGYFNGDFYGTLRELVYDVIGKSDEHRNILLNCNTIAFGIFTSNHRMYLTIRGK